MGQLEVLSLFPRTPCDLFPSLAASPAASLTWTLLEEICISSSTIRENSSQPSEQDFTLQTWVASPGSNPVNPAQVHSKLQNQDRAQV